MNIDEKIALLEKENRIRKRQERESAEAKVMEKKLIHTVERFQKDFKRGETFCSYKHLFIKPREFLNKQIKIPFIYEFFDLIEENEQTVWLASNVHHVTLILGVIYDNQHRDSSEHWAKEFPKQMKEKKLYCKVIKNQTMEHLDYLCYETPTAEGTLYNVTFRLIEDGRYFVGTFSCSNEECESMGVLLEAIVCEINDDKKR